MINFSLEPTGSLFEKPVQVTKEDLKSQALQRMKQDILMEAADHKLEISFDTPEGDDILIKKIDLENALGYRTFESEDAYFNQVDAELYRPSAEELGMNGNS